MPPRLTFLEQFTKDELNVIHDALIFTLNCLDGEQVHVYNEMNLVSTRSQIYLCRFKTKQYSMHQNKELTDYALNDKLRWSIKSSHGPSKSRIKSRIILSAEFDNFDQWGFYRALFT